MKLSGELSYRIGYDVEHDLFHAQNVFNDEYIKPTFIEYVQKLEKENAELKKFINAPLTKGRTTTRKEMFQSIWELSKQITNAKELILRLYNAGRDVLMCRAEEKAYDNLSNAINDKSIEQFLSEVENDIQS